MNKPLWYRILWRWGWRPRLFLVLSMAARMFQYPFSPPGFVTWGDYDGDFHLSIGDRDVVIDWRGRLVAGGDGEEWVITTRKIMPRITPPRYDATYFESIVLMDQEDTMHILDKEIE